MQKSISTVIESEIRPSIQSHGGDIQLIAISDGVVTVQLTGACTDCCALEFTINNGISKVLQDSFPEIREVKCLVGNTNS